MNPLHLGFMALSGASAIILGLAFYLLEAFAYYFAFKKAGIENAWLAFIPIAQLWPFMRVIKKSAWNLFWLLCPIANIVFAIIWQGRFLQAFGISRLWLLMYIGALIPFFSYLVNVGFLVLYCVIGFSSSIRYDPDFDGSSGPGGFTA